MASVCICQICTCGRHRCVHKKNVVLPKDYGRCYITEHQEAYPRKWVEPREGMGPSVVYRKSSKPMEDSTSYRTDYVPRDVKRPAKRPPIAYVPPTTRMEDMTSYIEEYNKKEIQPTESYRPRLAYLPPANKIQDESWSHACFKYPDPTDVRQPRIFHDCFLKPGGTFRGATTFKTDYIDHGPMKKRDYIIHNCEDMRSREPMEDQTMYGRDFSRKPIPDRVVFEKRVYAPPKKKMADTTTFMADYTPFKDHQRAFPLLPKQETIQSTAPFDGTTTFADCYKAWPNPAREEMPWANKGTFTAPTEAFAGNTSYKDDYVKHLGGRPNVILPKVGEPIYGNGAAKLNDKTTYTDDYPRKVASKMKSCRPDRTWTATEGTTPDTTSRESYKGIYAEPPKAIRPPYKLCNEWAENEDFCKDTTYGVDFQRNYFKKCPAVELIENPDRYAVTRNINGHTFYNTSKFKSVEDFDKVRFAEQVDVNKTINGGLSSSESTDSDGKASLKSKKKKGKSGCCKSKGNTGGNGQCRCSGSGGCSSCKCSGGNPTVAIGVVDCGQQGESVAVTPMCVC